jgi:DNA-binding transcriptional MerR regulator
MLSIGEFARLGQVSPRTLRHYGELGILEPAHVDSATVYRYCELGQLEDLRRVLALRGLGIGLEPIREFLGADGGASIELLRAACSDYAGAEISASIEEQDRRRRFGVASRWPGARR